MTPQAKRLLLPVCFLFCMTLIHGQGDWAVDKLRDAEELRIQGRLDEAISLLTAAIAEAARRSDVEPADLADLQLELANACLENNRPGEAKRHYRQAMANQEKQFGPDSVMLVEALEGLADIHITEGDLTAAEEVLKRTARIWTVTNGPEDPNAAHALLQLVDMYRAHGRTAEAEALLQDPRLEFHRQLEGAEPPVQVDELSTGERQFILSGEEPINMPPLTPTENVRPEEALPLTLAIAPCFDDLEYNSDMGRAALGALVKGSSGVYERIAKYLLPRLFVDHQVLGIPLHKVNAILENLGPIIRAGDALGALMAGDYAAAADNSAKGALIYLSAVKGIPFVSEMLTTLEIVQMSQAELQKQEDLLQSDLIYYEYMDDPELQRRLQTDPAGAVDYYIDHFMFMDQSHCDRVSAYLRQYHQREVQLNVDNRTFSGRNTNIRLLLKDPELRMWILGMLRDFEQRRASFRQASQQALQLRNDPLFQLLRSGMNTMADFNAAYEFFRQWCEEYARRTAGTPTIPTGQAGDRRYRLAYVELSVVEVTGTNSSGLPRDARELPRQTLAAASGSVPAQYSEQWATGHATLTGSVQYSFPPEIISRRNIDGQYALLTNYTITIQAQGSWSNAGLGFGRPTRVEIQGLEGPDLFDDCGMVQNETASAQVSATRPFGASLTVGVRVEFHGKQNRYITLRPVYEEIQKP